MSGDLSRGPAALDLATAPALEIVPDGPLHATFAAPASKSYTLRALVMAALADGESRIENSLESDDTARMREALAAFGVETAGTPDGLIVSGAAGRLAAPAAPIDCGLSGASMRILTALAALADGEAVLTGAPPLLRRPIAPLADALRSLGVQIRYLGEPGHPPISVRGPLRGGSAVIDASASSQFLTALLLAAPYAESTVRLDVVGLAARPYVDMTCASMTDFGAAVERESPRSIVVPPSRYRSRAYGVEYDASSAAHLLALAASAGGEVTLENAAGDTLQPDARMARYLAAMGCSVGRDGDRLTVQGAAPLRPLDLDLSDTPDMTTPLAVLCAFADGDSRLYNVAFVRGHETDRIAATAAELRKMGVSVEQDPDGLRIRGAVPSGARIATYHDHRMAMGFAAAGLRIPGVVIDDPGCVSKTYPGFWHDLAYAGVKIVARRE